MKSAALLVALILTGACTSNELPTTAKAEVVTWHLNDAVEFTVDGQTASIQVRTIGSGFAEFSGIPVSVKIAEPILLHSGNQWWEVARLLEANPNTGEVKVGVLDTLRKATKPSWG